MLENETLRKQANQTFHFLWASSSSQDLFLKICYLWIEHEMQVQELQAFFPSTSSPSMLCIEYNATVEKTDPVIKEGSGSPEMACDGGIADDEELADDEDSDTTLQLGYSLETLNLCPIYNRNKPK